MNVMNSSQKQVKCVGRSFKDKNGGILLTAIENKTVYGRTQWTAFFSGSMLRIMKWSHTMQDKAASYK